MTEEWPRLCSAPSMTPQSSWRSRGMSSPTSTSATGKPGDARWMRWQAAERGHAHLTAPGAEVSSAGSMALVAGHGYYPLLAAGWLVGAVVASWPHRGHTASAVSRSPVGSSSHSSSPPFSTSSENPERHETPQERLDFGRQLLGTSSTTGQTCLAPELSQLVALFPRRSAAGRRTRSTPPPSRARLRPDLTTSEALEVSAIHSLAGFALSEGLMTRPPFSDPHHSASAPSIIGGGQRMAKAGCDFLCTSG